MTTNQKKGINIKYQVIDNMDLSRGTMASLEATLNAAMRQLDRKSDKDILEVIKALESVGFRPTDYPEN
jgi:ABC-type uncharacterized transport system ATPase subunit